MGYFQPLVVYRNPNTERKNSILRYIGNRVLNNNRNFLCAVVGATGAGKSYACLKMSEEYSKMFNIPFNPKDHVITSLKELLILITRPEKERKLKFGSVIVFDEPQVEGNSRNWHSEINQALSQLVSTFRNQRLVVFFATPYLEMIDKQSRILFHGEFKVEGFDKNSKITTIKPRFLEYNKNKGDFYKKRLIIYYKEKGKKVMTVKKLDFWKIGLASKKTLEIYEEKKKEFTDNLNKKLLEQIISSEKKNEVKNKSEDIFKVEKLYDKYGQDYLKILAEMPHLTPFVLEKYILFIKRSRRAVKKNETVSKKKE